MPEPIKITQLGDQMLIYMDDNTKRTAVPTSGDLWYVDDMYVPPPPPPVTPPTSGGARFQWPFDPRPQSQGGTVSSEYGPRWGRIHQGIDFAPGEGTPIPAAGAGRAMLRQNGGFGNYIIIDHGTNFYTVYGHIRNGGYLIGDGAQVAKGQHIGLVGNTGNSTGPHLHWETHIGWPNWSNPGTHMNPRDFMAQHAG